MDVDEAGSLQAFATMQWQKEKKRKSDKNVGLRLETTNLVALRHKAAELITILQNYLPGTLFSILAVAQ
jgi:hypothetical protein